MGAFEDGMSIRRSVLGDAHVDRAIESATDLDRGFQDWITEHVWGGVWSRPGLDLKTRSMLAIAMLAALDREELRIHLRAAPSLGVTGEELSEILLQVGVYAGIPAANHAFRIAREVEEEAS
jgi:4-carboxymuconolactone decarboxylase